MSDRFWAQALKQYNQAAAITPQRSRRAPRTSHGSLHVGDFIGGDERRDEFPCSGSVRRVERAILHRQFFASVLQPDFWPVSETSLPRTRVTRQVEGKKERPLHFVARLLSGPPETNS